jgi:tellurite resistance protein TerC
MDFNNVYLWIGFGVIVTVLLALDLGVFHRKSHAVNTREAAIWVGVWVTLALIFNLAIYIWHGPETALEYFTGYIIEYSLSIDNLFVFVIIFGSFCVNPAQQHRVLFWGILGALIMRGIMIATGAALIERFFWIIYIFGAFLIFTGIKMGVKKETDPHPDKNPIVRLARRFLPMETDDHDGKFFVKSGGKLFITPLFLVLLTVETTDLVFALDSIPAIFAITTNTFVIYTSNIFAILGLRSLYFLLAGMVTKFYYLQTSLAVILTYVGIKMIISHFYKISTVASLVFIVAALTTGIIFSLVRDKRIKLKIERGEFCPSDSGNIPEEEN